MKYIYLPTGKQTDELPRTLDINGQFFASSTSLPLELCAKVGWREMPEAPKPAEGTQIVSVTWVQDAIDPLKVAPIVESKTDAAIAQEKADAEKAQADAQAANDAKIKAGRDEIIEAFPDKLQQAVMLRSYDRWPW